MQQQAIFTRKWIVNLALLSILLITTMAEAVTFYVAPAGTGSGLSPDQPTDLQSALTLAQDNGEDDTLHLRKGTYRGNFTYEPAANGEALILAGGWNQDYSRRSTEPDTTILDGQQSGKTLQLNNWWSPVTTGDITIRNITLRNGLSGTSNGPGGGLYAGTGSSGGITLEHVIIENNTSDAIGGGCALAAGNPKTDTGASILLKDVIIRNNSSRGLTNPNTAEQESGRGGGCFLTAMASTRLINCLVYDNTAGTDGVYAGFGGGLYLLAFNGKVIITSSTITGNHVYQGQPLNISNGGGIYLDTDDDSWSPSSFWIGNTIFHDNHSQLAAGADDIVNDLQGTGAASGTVLRVDHCDYHDLVNIGSVIPVIEGNIDADPNFSRLPGKRYHLTRQSPCVDSGNNSDPYQPARDLEGKKRIIDGNRDSVPVIDMGCYEYRPSFPWTMLVPAVTHGANR
jgi:hypothetical protein